MNANRRARYCYETNLKQIVYFLIFNHARGYRHFASIGRSELIQDEQIMYRQNKSSTILWRQHGQNRYRASGELVENWSTCWFRGKVWIMIDYQYGRYKYGKLHDTVKRSSQLQNHSYINVQSHCNCSM